MRPFAVEWVADAATELARIWIGAGDRAAVTAAQNQIDKLLERDPVGNGQHRSEGLYRIDVSPLSCTYTIDDVGRRVEVTWVWYSP
ncbi:MAG: hypothetical protein JO112_21285 [Planctomycetes bacterium]|nr:hypothetical protein [Planctomycetota bacterium]